MTQQEAQMRKQLIIASAPHLIDKALLLMGLSTVPAALSRSAVAYALAKCANSPERVAELRWEWLERHGSESWLTFVGRKTR